ncbi:2532_t:CDS:2 [Funneliformis mosseae]|uniref:2532_t:CDS:1 n=1 Tax=Funneliformis mosseae TaxID=27381 RepID=A0A9N8W0N0_FUNMO|nr:2532_t:CDS:2 [Funneliformis mosseae]
MASWIIQEIITKFACQISGYDHLQNTNAVMESRSLLLTIIMANGDEKMMAVVVKNSTGRRNTFTANMMQLSKLA